MATSGEQESLLHHASWTGETERILGLLEQGTDPNELDHLGWTPLHTDALSGNIESVSCSSPAPTQPPRMDMDALLWSLPKRGGIERSHTP